MSFITTVMASTPHPTTLTPHPQGFKAAKAAYEALPNKGDDVAVRPAPDHKLVAGGGQQDHDLPDLKRHLRSKRCHSRGQLAFIGHTG